MANNSGLSTPEGPEIERPVRHLEADARYGSDVVAETLRALGLSYISLVPGASFRGLHDSLINRLGNVDPQMLVCLHEESAVAVAHGWAKVTGRPMAVALHSNVGLFHATMAIFNAWCDRAPMLVIGATGPVDAAKRRPWIDWIHTAADQGAILRHYVKWDAQPASPTAAQEALLRAAWLCGSPPMGPVYVNLDAGMQEAPLTEPVAPAMPDRFMPTMPGGVPGYALEEASRLLREAGAPLILMGRVSRDSNDWAARVALAEALNAKVATDLKVGAAFPTTHRLHVGVPRTFPSEEVLAAIRAADVVLSLDWVDLGGTLRSTHGDVPPGRVIQVSLDYQLHNGWSMDHQALPVVDLMLPASPDAIVAGLLGSLGITKRREPASEPVIPPVPGSGGSGEISMTALAVTLRSTLSGRRVSLLHVPLAWSAADWPFSHPLDYIGTEGGAGIGAGPGIAVGAALALRNSGRLPAAILGDGDFLMGATALWTAVHYGIPLLVIVANNRCFHNDEVHQERMALQRNRPVQNKWIGQRLTEPDIDLAALARAQGAQGFGPVTDASELVRTFIAAVAAVEAGSVAVVDVRVATSDVAR